MNDHNHRWKLVQRVLVVFAFELALVSVLVSASVELRLRRGDSYTIGLTPSRSVVVNVWPVGAMADHFSPYVYYYSYTNLHTNYRLVDVWYEDTATSTRSRLATFTLPTWPLTAATGLTWLLVLATAWGRRPRPVRASPASTALPTFLSR
jgi:hypothetical protein